MGEEKLRLVRGMRDLIFDDAEKLIFIINKAREISYKYGYKEAILPTIEYYSLFAEKSGYEITKRMYVFEDLSGRKLALRPELTPSVARLFINSLQSLPKPIRISYFANVFRYDEPQKARYREFWQGGFEHLGSSSLIADIEVIKLAFDIFNSLKLGEVKIKLGSMDLIKKILNNAGVEYGSIPYFLYLIDKKKFEELKKELSKHEKGEIYYELLVQLSNLKGDPLSIISKSREIIKDERLLSSINDLEFIITSLMHLGIQNIELELSFARGIEYYTGIIYEFLHKDLDVSIGGGGRYDLLIEYYGGPKTPATGCALGLDRIALVFKGDFKKNLNSASIFLLEQTNDTLSKAFEISSFLRNQNYIVTIETSEKNLSEALSKASKQNYDLFIIIGGKEFKEGKIVVRDLKKRIQREVSISKLQDILEKE